MNTSTGMSNNNSSDGYVPSTVVKMTIVTIFGVILLVGILGNILIIAIIACVKTMRTTVNKCLFSLALTDLVILIILPVLPITEELTDNTVPIGTDFCRFTTIYDIAAPISSVFTFYYVTVDRYFALCYPLKPRRFWTSKKMYVTLLAFWIIALIMAVPFLISSKYEIEAGVNVTYYYCHFGDEDWMMGYYTFVILFAFFVPLPIMLTLYGRMMHHLREPISTSGTKVKINEVKGRRGRGQVVIMLFVLTVIFVFSQIPFNLIVLCFYYFPGVLQSNPFDKLSFILTWVTRLLIYVNSASNPIIYFAMSTNFRQAFRELCCCRANQQNISQKSVSMTTISQLGSQ